MSNQRNLCGVFAVPPLARRNDPKRSIDFEQNDRIVSHIVNGGITRLLYGGNAFLYHVSLAEFEQMLEWLSAKTEDAWFIPSIGPSFGRAIDQASLIRKYSFTTAMLLPCADPRDADGLERGYREFAEAANCKLIVYLKDENNFGCDKHAGLDAVARLVNDGICVAIKYAVVRDDPKRDDYLDALLARVDRKNVISGIGERPAIIHLDDWSLTGFTTGSGCIAPNLTQQLFEALTRQDFESASQLRERFIPLEDLRDAWGPARVLHHATELAGIAKSGPIPPYVSPLNVEQLQRLENVVHELIAEKNQ
jgi:dihydrodipicolinate synthase/N-acetylneuraminate lyase